MKKIKLSTVGPIVFMGYGLLGCAQQMDVPKPVGEAFVQKFPSAQKVKWDKESDIEWEAEFKMNGVSYSANFLDDGTWQETEHEVKLKEVPEKVKNALHENFVSYKTETVEVSETVKGTLYEFELEKGRDELEVVIDLSGTIVKKENAKESGESEKD